MRQSILIALLFVFLGVFYAMLHWHCVWGVILITALISRMGFTAIIEGMWRGRFNLGMKDFHTLFALPEFTLPAVGDMSNIQVQIVHRKLLPKNIYNYSPKNISYIMFLLMTKCAKIDSNIFTIPKCTLNIN